MDTGYISGLAALAGSAIGALASLVTAWLTQHSQTRVTQRWQDQARREALYGEFIREASKLFADASEHELDYPAKLVQLYAIVSTIRLFGQQRTLEEAERDMNRIGATYCAPNKDIRLFADIASSISFARSAMLAVRNFSSRDYSGRRIPAARRGDCHSRGLLGGRARNTGGPA